MDVLEFVQNVKAILDERRISYARAGRECGAGEEFIRNMERKGSAPSVEKVQQMANYLGMTTSELLGEVPSVPSGQQLPADEVQLLQLYRSLRPEDRPRALGVLEGIASGYTQAAGDGGEKRLA